MEDEGPGLSDADTASPATPIRGFISTRYRYRATDDDSDQDIYQYLNLDVGDPRLHKVTGHLFARGTADIDGKGDTGGYYVFDSIADTYDNNLNGRVYYAYLDIHETKGLELVRIGRQLMYEAPEALYFDGARVETAELDSAFKFKAGAYGGVPVHYLYESDPGEDIVYGAFVQARPWLGGKLQLHWTHLEDDGPYGEEDEEDNLYSMELWQTAGDKFRINALYTRFDQEDRDILVRVDYYDPEMDLILQGSYFELLSARDIHAIALDPFFASEKRYYPYRQIGFTFSKGFGENIMVDGGVMGRMLKDHDDEGQYNHEFLRYFLALYFEDLPYEGLEASLTGEAYESYTLEERIVAVDAEAGYHFSERLEVYGGADFSLYKYDYYLDSERDQVWTYYARLKYRPSEALIFGLDYQFEDDDYDDYHRFEFDIRYVF